MSIERNFDIAFVSNLALHEKQIQQEYRPIIAIHKWFARRPGTLFRSLLLAEFAEGNLVENYYRAHNFKGLKVADPFMGGGTPLIEANRLGCDIIGYDINPMAYWIVNQEIEYIDLKTYQNMAEHLKNFLIEKVGRYYQTRCPICGEKDAWVKYFLWVKVQHCRNCDQEFDLFPGYLLAEKRRHPKYVIICATCGELNEVEDKKDPGKCHHCKQKLLISGPANRNQCVCPHCGTNNFYPVSGEAPPKHRMFAIEYHCFRCKSKHNGRFFKKPDAQDLEKYDEVLNMWKDLQPCFVPEEEIPKGDETDRLHRWGYHYYREMFNERQLFGLELLAREIMRCNNERIKNALATNFSDLLRYQNMLCRYDTYALKSLDIFSLHGFPVGLIQCESNLIGIINKKTGAKIGSGGWINIVDKYLKAKQYCLSPFEIKHENGRKFKVKIPGEWIGEFRQETGERREVNLLCESSIKADLKPYSLDAVITDPPYFDNIQYAELMDFCYVWLRRFMKDNSTFISKTTRNPQELTVNNTMSRGIDHFTNGLTQVFKKMVENLKSGAPFVFTYHHNKIEAYYPIAVALLDTGLVCTTTLPCPAEMAASIHINGTGSSIIDTVFVCRTTGVISKKLLVREPEKIAQLVIDDIQKLKEGGVPVTRGDVRCIIFGHIIRLTVWYLRQDWNKDIPIGKKLDLIKRMTKEFRMNTIEDLLQQNGNELKNYREAKICEDKKVYKEDLNEISF